MPRTARAVEAGLIYHALNRGNGRQMLFRRPADFDAFERILAEGLARDPGAVDLLAWCLMGNHWHLVLRPRRRPDALPRLLAWVGVTHVRRHHARHATAGGGHLYQGRYKSFPVQDDHHFLTLCRYVEANPLRAGLVERAQDWRWSSLRSRDDDGDDAANDAGNDATARADRRDRRKSDDGGRELILRAAPWPIERPRNWAARVNAALPAAQAERIRTSVARQRPYGGTAWVERTATRLGLGWTLRPRGRPRKAARKE